MTPSEELFEIAKKLEKSASVVESDNILEPILALEKAAQEIKRSFSGSWLGYHSCVYYADLAPAPPGANFSQEWGLEDVFGDMGSYGDWRQFDPEYVKSYIDQQAGTPNLEPARDAFKTTQELFSSLKSEVISILSNELDQNSDGFLENLVVEIEELKPLAINDVIHLWTPKGQIMTRDMVAMGQGYRAPPHVFPLAEVNSIQHLFGICKNAAEVCKKSASHLGRKRKKTIANERIGTNVFIGHGQSSAWRELKDFVQDRLKLPYDEFNRVPVAGLTNIARLSEMLDAASIALLVMTAEDELADGDFQARMNVVHEAGLFQGRLSFTRAIVLLEDGCEEFSNIQGLGQIRFPKGNIAASFEEVRRVLEREGLIQTE